MNTAFLVADAMLAASLIGTTGASMVLIRPLLQTNREREHVRHTVVFFIFLVSNIGGCLLPTGDPPLFLGYLSGVPFDWTLSLVLPWLFSVVVLLAVYFVWDNLAYRRQRSPRAPRIDDALCTPRRSATTRRDQPRLARRSDPLRRPDRAGPALAGLTDHRSSSTGASGRR